MKTKRGSEPTLAQQQLELQRRAIALEEAKLAHGKRKNLFRLLSILSLSLVGCCGITVIFSVFTEPERHAATQTSIAFTAIAAADTATARASITPSATFTPSQTFTASTTPTASDTPTAMATFTSSYTPSATNIPTLTPIEPTTASIEIASLEPALTPVYLIVTSTPSNINATVSGTIANIRSTPGTAGTLLVTLKFGNTLNILARTAGSEWYFVSFNGGKGWVRADLISTVSNPALVSVDYSVSITDATAVPIVAAPVNNSSGGSSNTNGAGGAVSSGVCPRNCDEARAMGVSSQFAAQCGLDGDRDGDACYEDNRN